MRKKGRKCLVKGMAISEISVLILATLAFGFVLAETEIVDAQFRYYRNTVDDSRYAYDASTKQTYKWNEGAVKWDQTTVKVTPTDTNTWRPISEPPSPEVFPPSTEAAGAAAPNDGRAPPAATPKQGERDPNGDKQDRSNLETATGLAASLASLTKSSTVKVPTEISSFHNELSAGKTASDFKIGTTDYNGIKSADGKYFVESGSRKIYQIDGENVKETGFSLEEKTGKVTGAPAPGTDYLGALWGGLQYAMGAAAIVGMIAGLAGLQTGQTVSLTAAAFAGMFVGKTLFDMGLTGTVASIGIGVAVAGAILLTTYKKESKKTVTFTCMPYEPPVGGAKCEECNKDPFKPCSEYRCRSLGQACQLLNKETPGKEQCAWINPKDVSSPTITPWVDALKPTGQGLKYISDTSVRPPALGVKIVRGNASCLEAYTKLEFGIMTNEPAQCKLSFNHTRNMSDMEFDFGDTNYYEYNHTQVFRLPGPNVTEEQAVPLFQNDGTMGLYVRCQDANGNQNVDEYKISFCVNKGPDTTPPRIEGTSIVQGGFVRYNADKVPIEVFANEPSECKWSKQDKSYDQMENNMTCATSPEEINAQLSYTCSSNLTGIENNKENNFYFRCKDQPEKEDKDRNTMVQSYALTIKGSQLLNIIKLSPYNETIKGSTEVITFDLTLETDDGAEEGKAFCSFSTTGLDGSYTLMYETNDYRHNQSQSLTNGTYTYYFECTDLGGNTARNSTTFSIFVDRINPKVTRVYNDETSGLRVATDEDAECAYSWTTCNFKMSEGIKMIYSNPSAKNVHYAQWEKNRAYYIKCMDIYGNAPENPNECSIIVNSV